MWWFLFRFHWFLFCWQARFWQIAFCGVRVKEAAVPGPLDQENGNHVNGIFLNAEEAAPSLSRGNDVVEDIMARKRHFRDLLLA